MPALKRVTDEIEEALVIVCESHDLPAAQVWIPYENENYLPFEPCADGTQTKGKFAVKLVGYCVDSDDRLCKSCHDTCDTLPLKIEDGLVGKTFETYQPHFCTNIYDMGRYERTRDNTLLAFLSATARCSCFVICMRSIDTGDLIYAFEFLWPQTRNYLILLESMLLTLKRCLPHFKLASGARFGDELRIIDVENSTGGGGIGSFAIL
ncbi:NIN-like protein [Artemisia annua]|uniref:NIN-like protein n=1 Tax=Artemisia annua TaxID=35608 RepID=A0A2U1MPR1_ARTAN|nr:NIN-like protein [Artemisia annua]